MTNLQKILLSIFEIDGDNSHILDARYGSEPKNI